MHKYFLLGLVASTAMYGALALLVSVFALGFGPSSILDAAGQRDGLLGWFCAYMAISLVAYPVVVALHVLMIQISNKIAGRSSDRGSAVGMIPRLVYVEFTNPFTGVIGPIGARHSIDGGGLYDVVQWLTVILFFVWSVLLWLWLGAGLITVAR